MKNSNDIIPNINLDLKQVTSHQKPVSDSTSTSLNEEPQKNLYEHNNNYNLNINQNIKNIKLINMEIENINEDIFPKERLSGNANYKCIDRRVNNKYNTNIIENILSKNKEIIMKEDIPEMILYKYNYDINLYKESLKDIDYETQWLYDYLKIEKTIKDNEEKSIEIKKCIKSLLIEHKVKKCDIPFIIINFQNLYNKFFTQNQVFELLSIYDVEFLRLQKKRKRIFNIFNYITKDEDSNLSKEISNYFKKEYILEANNESELDIIELQLGILTYVYQLVDIDENYKKLINYEILSNIDLSLLDIIKDSKLNDILNKFCLSPEQVVHNLKILNGEINSELIEPPFINCSLGELCKQKISEISGKYTSPKEVLRLSLEYYILLLSSHPYIFKLIYKKFYKTCTLSTNPTEKGKDILNSLHPSYHIKRINNMPISSFFEEKNENIFNIYTNELGDIFLDIEKCVNNGLIKCDINPGVNVLENNSEIEQLIKILSKAINGIKDDKSDDDKNSPQIIKNMGARNVALRNMIYFKNFSQGFFLDYIKKELHKYSEKYIIKEISNKFFNLISRNYIDNVILDDDSYIFSIIYNSQKKYFKCICLDANYKCKTSMKLEYLWKNEKISEASLNETLNLSKEVSNFKSLITLCQPQIIIIDVSNLESYKMISYIRNRFKDINLIYSDYISKIYKIKIVEKSEEQEIKQSIDQVKYIFRPVNQILELWNYKYEDNLLLKLNLHPLQENIKDIEFINYSLENQIIKVVNSKGIILANLPKYSYYLFNFLSGLGPSTSSLILNNMNNYYMLKNSLIQNNPNIYQNINPFIKGNINNEYNNNIYNLKKNDGKYGLVKLEVFNSMIKDSMYFKKNCLCNAIVSDVDMKNQIVNCIILRDCNSIKAILKFSNIDLNIQNIQKFFYPQRIILCKIIDIILKHQSYEILLSNKNDDLLSVKDFWVETQKFPELEKYSVNVDEDFIIKDIKKLKEIQLYNQNKEPKLLKYSLINMENEQFLLNTNYNSTKRIFESYKSIEYKIRPSFLGENHLILTCRLIEDIYLNYDIEIIKIELDNVNVNHEKTINISYKIENNSYKSLNELVDLFAVRIAKKIKDFKKNEYFKPPSEIQTLFFQIFNIKSNIVDKKTKNLNKMDISDNDEIIKRNDIILSFMRESPNYGILFTKSNNEYNYTIDFIKILHNGYLFHGKLFIYLNDLITFYKDVHNTTHYQNFIKRQFICNVHSQIEEIDEQYIEFEGVDPSLHRYTNQENQIEALKNELMDQGSNSLIGRKRKADYDTNSIWNNLSTNNEVNLGELNNNNLNDDWADNSKNNNKFNNYNNKTFDDKNYKNKDNNFSKNKKKFDGNKNSWNNKKNNDNLNNLNDNENDLWGKSNNNYDLNNNNKTNNVWGKNNQNNDSWGSSNNNNIQLDEDDVWGLDYNNNENTKKNNSNNKNEPWKNKIDSAWDTSNKIEIKNNLNINDNSEWVNNDFSNNKDSRNNLRNNKNSYNNKKNKRNNNNTNNNNTSNFDWNSNNNKNASNNDIWGEKKNPNTSNNSNNNDSWNNPSNNQNTDDWTNSNNNDNWNNSNNNNNWNNSKNNDNWNNSNNNDNWNNSNNNDNWNNSNNNSSNKRVTNSNYNNTWTNSNNNDNWNNSNNNDNWNNSNNNDNWNNQKKNNWEKSNDKIKEEGWANTNNNNTFGKSNNTVNKNNDSWGNSNNNSNDNWASSKSCSEKWESPDNQINSYNNSNNNNNKNNNFRKNNSNSNFNNNKSWNKSNNNKNNNNNENNFRQKNKNFNNHNYNYNNNNNNNNNRSSNIKNKSNNNYSINWEKNQNNNNNTQSSFLGWNKKSSDNNGNDNDINWHSNYNTNNKNNNNNKRNNSNYNNNNRSNFNNLEKANNNNKNSWNNFDNNRSKNNNNKNKNKKKKGWASELDNNYDGSKEIKQEDNEGEVINFEKQDEFGGYTIDKNDK